MDSPIVRTLEHIETDTTQLVNVGMENLCEESNLGRSHGVVFRQEKLEFENTACKQLSDMKT